MGRSTSNTPASSSLARTLDVIDFAKLRSDCFQPATLGDRPDDCITTTEKAITQHRMSRTDIF
eukprot:1860522-Ditylum_brightwellii.AAC.1